MKLRKNNLLILIKVLHNILTLPSVFAAKNERCKAGNIGFGVCIDSDECKKGGGKTYSNFCRGDPKNIKCCIKTVTELKNGTKLEKEGICKNSKNCPVEYNTQYKGYCPGDENIVLCVNNDRNILISKISQKEIDSIINNLKTNLNPKYCKSAAKIKAAEEMLKFEDGTPKYDPKYVAGMLGNIEHEGIPGKLESSAYAESNKPEYLKIMDDKCEYKKYSGGNISNIGIKKVNELYDCGAKNGGTFGLGMIQWTDSRNSDLIKEYENYSKKKKK